MNIHYLQHVAFEGLGSIEDWVRGGSHSLSATRLYLGEGGDGLRRHRKRLCRLSPVLSRPARRIAATRFHGPDMT